MNLRTWELLDWRVYRQPIPDCYSKEDSNRLWYHEMSDWKSITFLNDAPRPALPMPSFWKMHILVFAPHPFECIWLTDKLSEICAICLPQLFRANRRHCDWWSIWCRRPRHQHHHQSELTKENANDAEKTCKKQKEVEWTRGNLNQAEETSINQIEPQRNRNKLNKQDRIWKHSEEHDRTR